MATTTSSARSSAQDTGPSPVDAMREVFAGLPSGVCVITCADEHGRYGMTASAVCSLSLRPRLVVVCVANRCTTLARLRGVGRFAVNVLRADQATTATQFAAAGGGPAKFAGVRHQLVDGSPVFDDALSWLTCDLHDTFPGGDHTLVVGAVTAVHTNDGEPLVWHDHRYRTVA